MNRGTEISLAVIAIVFITVGFWWWYANTPKQDKIPFAGVEQHTQIGTRSGFLNDTGLYYAQKAAYPLETPIEGTGGESAVSTMKAFAQNEMAAFKLQNNLDALSAEDIEMLGLNQGRKYTLDITFETYRSASTVSYAFLIYQDTLGAHPNSYYRTFTWDTQTGKALSLYDITKNQEYLSKISTFSRDVLTKKLGENANNDMIEAGTTPEEENFQNFVVSGESIQVIFAPYQVGPYAIGAQTVTIPLSYFSTIPAQQ